MVRIPTLDERLELLDYVVNRNYVEPTKEDWDTEREYLENIWIAVFDDYITDGPGYAGRVMVVIWGGDPSFTETFVWDRTAHYHAGGPPTWSEPKLTKVEIEV